MDHIGWLIVTVPESIVLLVSQYTSACDDSIITVLMKTAVVQPYQAHHTHSEHPESVRAMSRISVFQFHSSQIQHTKVHNFNVHSVSMSKIGEGEECPFLNVYTHCTSSHLHIIIFCCAAVFMVYFWL